MLRILDESSRLPAFGATTSTENKNATVPRHICWPKFFCSLIFLNIILDIVSFKIDTETGALQKVAEISAPSPVCLKFL